MFGIKGKKWWGKNVLAKYAYNPVTLMIPTQLSWEFVRLRYSEPAVKYIHNT